MGDTDEQRLFRAIQDNNVETASLIIQVGQMNGTAGALVNCTSYGGYTPLHRAAQHGALPMVQMLLAAGADVHAETDGGQTAFHLANERLDYNPGAWGERPACAELRQKHE